MKIERSEKFMEQYAAAPANVRAACDKQLALLANNLRHPSLRAKRFLDTWQARVTRSWRMYFDIVGDTYHLTSIIAHPK